MKKIYLLTGFCFVCLALTASPRSLQQARRLVAGAQHVHTALQTNGQPAFYVFNKPNDGGFVLISADDRTYTVLGYSDTGHWDENDLPENARAWFESYAETISALPEAYHPSAPQQTASYTPVAPLCETNWGQTAPYNNLCPSTSSGHAVSGCVSIAASQIMKRYAYPEHGTGSHAYKWATENGDSIILSANFENTTYDWTNMLNRYDSVESTQAQQTAVATLVYHCGVAANMKYGADASSANSNTMIKALMTYFGYDKGIHRLFKDYAGEAILEQAMYEDLRAGRPVYISAKTVRNEGHAFICDGIDADGLFHINWGWLGKSDGYFRFSALNPQEQGTGGSTTNQGFNENLQIFTHIRPDVGGDYVHSMTCENIKLAQTACHRDSLVRLTVDTFYNRGYTDWTGNLKLYIYKDGKLYKTKTSSSRNPLPSNYYYHYVKYSANFSDTAVYKEGEYEMVVAARADDQPDAYIPIYRKWLGEWRCKMTITSDSIYLTPPTVTPPEHPYVADPREYDLTLLRALYYPSDSEENHHRWKLQLSTGGFYTNDDEDQLLLLFNIYTHSDKSIIGYYPADKDAIHNCGSAYHFYGNANDALRTDANEGECRFSYNEADNTYRCIYRIRLYQEDYQDTVEFRMNDIIAYYAEADGTHKKNERITLDNTPQGLDAQLSDTPKAQKIIRNGVLYIRRGKDLYTITGLKAGVE